MPVTIRKQERGSNKIQRRARRPAQAILSAMLAIVFFALPLHSSTTGAHVSAQGTGGKVFLPVISGGVGFPAGDAFHIPFIDDDSSYNVMTKRYKELGIFWFGRVTPTENFANVRFGHNRYVLIVDISIIDNQLWYDESKTPAANFSAWDAVSLYISVPGQNRLLRFDAELNHWQDRGLYQAAYQRSGSGWSRVQIPFTTETGWWGEGLNGPNADEGWHVTYRVPFSSLGLTSPPPTGSTIKMGMTVYDRDSATGTQPAPKSWPDGLNALQEASYGLFTFGYPEFRRPNRPAAGTAAIKQTGQVTVEDASVGGDTTCGQNGKDKWTEWANRVYNQKPENERAVIQNQSLIADFPCFSRYYITFPLDAIPPGKVILSATLTMHQYGGSDPSNAQDSYIQVLRVNDPWSPSTINWNNAPQAVENYPGAWVPPLPSYPGVPGVARTWDVSQAVADVYGSDRLLRLALYSADDAMHSGKYFWSSETASWSSVTPPTLTVTWANP